MTSTTAVHTRSVHRSLRTPVAWGVVVGVFQTASRWAFSWLDPATVYALGLAVIAAIYIGFAVADGRPHVLAVETAVASSFVVIAAALIVSFEPLGRRFAFPGRLRTYPAVRVALLAAAAAAASRAHDTASLAMPLELAA